MSSYKGKNLQNQKMGPDFLTDWATKKNIYLFKINIFNITFKSQNTQNFIRMHLMSNLMDFGCWNFLKTDPRFSMIHGKILTFPTLLCKSFFKNKYLHLFRYKRCLKICQQLKSSTNIWKKTNEITFLVMEHYQLNLSYVLHKTFHLFLKTRQPAFVNNKGFWTLTDM